MAMSGMIFDQEEAHSSVLESFLDFVSQYGYSYDALSREPPSTCKEDAEIAAWREIDMRKVFFREVFPQEPSEAV